MAPSTACISTQLRHMVYYHIDNNSLKNALFFAERLAAYDPRSTEGSYLLGICHLRLGDDASAYEYTKLAALRGVHLGCAYTFAQACLTLERYKDGIMALEKSRGLWGGKNHFGKNTTSQRQQLPDAAAVCCLLGKLYHGYNDKKKAASFFEEALKLNPFMWDAFTNLSDMGTNVRVSNIFRLNPELEAVLKGSMQDTGDAEFEGKEAGKFATQDQPSGRMAAKPIASISDIADPFNTTSSRGLTGGLFGSFGMSQKLSESNPSSTNLPAAGGGGIGADAIETPTGPSASVDNSVIPGRRERDAGLMSAYHLEPPQAPARRNRTLHGLGMEIGVDPPKMGRSGTIRRTHRPQEQPEESAAAQAVRGINLIPPVERKRTISGQAVSRQPSEEPGAPQRRSVRLFNQIRPTSKSTTAGGSIGPAAGRELKKARPPISRIMKPTSSTSTVGRQVSGNRKPADDSMDFDQKEGAVRQVHAGIPMQRQSESEKQEEALKWLLDLFKKFANGYFALSQFRCQEALQLYSALPRAQQETPWVMSQFGRAHYEQAAYADAEKYYRRIRQLAPTRFEDMEIYSTILWHLKRETDLAFLAHELIDSSWKSPQAWCALGNSWSLASDHEQALRCFKRATQLDSKFAYAFTLQGHEHVANEEYDKALQSYRQSITADSRHYNAWYGVGRVYEKLGKYDKAFTHFQSASLINPTNAVLICCIGAVLDKQRQPRQALTYFTKATDLAPRSTLTRFKKARALMAIGELDAAMKELMILKDLAPDEAMVHFLLGRLYKSLKEKGLAVRHFTIALNLDPKASQHIKTAIESLEDDEDEDEPSMMM